MATRAPPGGRAGGLAADNRMWRRLSATLGCSDPLPLEQFPLLDKMNELWVVDGCIDRGYRLISLWSVAAFLTRLSLPVFHVDTSNFVRAIQYIQTIYSNFFGIFS